MYFLKRVKSGLNAAIKLAIHFMGVIIIKPFIGKPDFKKLDPHKPYKIFCVHLAYRGDLAINFPAVNVLKNHFPNSQISGWLNENNIPLAILNPAIWFIQAFINVILPLNRWAKRIDVPSRGYTEARRDDI
jgi:hypothetical protein